MQDAPSDSYTYVISIYGAEAVTKAKQIRGQLVGELAAAEKQLAQATGQTLDVISSQTRRLSYNMTRLQEVTQAADALTEAWIRSVRLIQATSDGVFDTFVAEARDAYEKTGGHSYFNQIYFAFKRLVANIRSSSEGSFDPLVQEAREAAQQVIQQIQGVTDAAGKLRFPPGAALQGVSIAGREATPEKIERYNQGMLQLNDVMTGIPLASTEAQRALQEQGYVVGQTTGFWEQLTDELNVATLQYFGVRRLGYGLEQFGSQLARSGRRNIGILMDWAQAYVDFNQQATLAAAAMEMTAEEQSMLEDTVLNNIEAMRMFDPSETVDGLRIWAAGTGQVVHSQEQLNEMLLQTRDIQVLAALGNEQLAETMENVGAGVAEYGLSLNDTDRVARVFNFTAAKTFAQIGDIGDSFKLVGPYAASYGVSLEETASIMGLLSDRNIKGTMSGRAFRQMLIQLAKPTQQHTDLLNEALGLNEKLGESWQDLVFPEGEFIGVASYIDLIAAATENMDTQQKSALLATMATANELSSLTALIDLQTQARKEGINVIRAWTKWMVGAADDEVEAFARLMRETRDVEVDTATDMYSLWAQQAQAYYDSEAAKAQQLERRWGAMQTALGKIVLEEGAPIVENLIEQLEKVVKFAAEHPALVTGLIVGAAAQLVMGNLISVTGQLVGVIANWLILKGAFAAFGGAVGTFQAAVSQFSVAVWGGKGKVPGDGTVEKAAAGGAVVALRALGITGALVTFIDQPSAGQREREEMMRILRELGMTAEQWDELFREGFEWQAIPGPGAYGAAGYELAGMVEGERVVLDVQGVLAILESLGQLTDEQEAALAELRMAQPFLGVDIEAELPPELQWLLEGESTTWEIDVDVSGLTAEDMQLLQLYDEMIEALSELDKEYTRKSTALFKDMWRDLQDAHEEYQQDIADARRDHYREEEDAYRKHMQKLADIQANIEAQMAEELIRLGERIDEVWIRAAERIAEAEEETNRKIEEAREEHLKTLRRMEEDHRDALVDLAIRRDAYGIWQEMRSYNKRVARENEDYEDRMRSLQESGRDRIDEIRRQAVREEAELRRAYERRMVELERQLERQLEEERRRYAQAEKERDKQFKRELRELKEKYEREQQDRLDAYKQDLQDLRDKHEEERREIQRAKTIEMATLRGYYQEGLNDLTWYLEYRLRQVEAYLQAEQDLWNSFEPYPTDGGDDGGTGVVPPGTPPPPGIPYDVYMPPVVQPTLTVEGTVAVAVDVTGDLPEGAAQQLSVNLEALFEQSLRRLEVSYG